MELWEERLSRREFLGVTAAAAASLHPLGRAALAQTAKLPKPAHSGLDHIVMVMMENRSFDHMLGWLPGANGKQAGLTYFDRLNQPHETFPLAPDFQGCRYGDPDHSYDGSRIEWNNGACDGWLRTKPGETDIWAIGYYQQADLPFLGQAAPAFTTCDNFFSSIMASTYPNRIYSLSGVTDRLGTTNTRIELPTIFDRLSAKRISSGYYYDNFSFLSLYGTHRELQHPRSVFFKQCKTGKLPAFSYVDPTWELQDTGPASGSGGNDDHPHSDIRAGEYFLSQIYNAVTRSPAWPRTLLIITFDECGGFFDHVPPPAANDVKPEYEQRGFRVPTLLISPFARRGHVAHGVYDHTSVLKLLEWRFGLKPLSQRDAQANNLAAALDFSHRRLKVPKIAAPKVLVGARCP